MAKRREFRLEDGRLAQWYGDGRLIIRDTKGKINENLLPSAAASQQASGSRKPDETLVDAILDEVGKRDSAVFRKLAERVAKGETRAIVDLIEFARLDQQEAAEDAPAIQEWNPGYYAKIEGVIYMTAKISAPCIKRILQAMEEKIRKDHLKAKKQS
jgi:hypothetical protein